MTSASRNSDWVERLCVVIAVHNRLDFTRKCLRSLQEQTLGAPRLIVVDDGSTDGTAEALRAEFPKVEVVPGSGNDWWSGATNRGVQRALALSAEWVFLVNNDTELAPDCLAELQAAARRYPVALLGCANYDIADGHLLYAGTRLNWWPGPLEIPISNTDDRHLMRVTHLPGRGMLVPAAAFHRIGLFDAVQFPQRYADYDFSYRAFHAGFPVMVCLKARLRSHSYASSGAQYRNQHSFRGLFAHLTQVNGQGNLRHFVIWAWRHCPRTTLIPYVLWGIAVRIGGWIRDWIFSTATTGDPS